MAAWFHLALKFNILQMVIFQRMPDDVSVLILVRLPVKSLCRYKCVSKSWNSFIRDRRFVARHTVFERRNSDFLLVNRLDQYSQNQVLSFVSLKTFESTGADVIYPLNRIQGANRFVLQISGSCNGIFCLFDGRETIALWNPAMKELKVLPSSNIAFPPHSTVLETCVGFGFDPISEDFKVLAFKHMCAPSYAAMAHAELYTLSSNKWKLIKIDDGFHPIGNLPISSFNPSINGVFSWFEMDDHAQKVVFSFDMSNEVFVKTHLPNYGIPSKLLHGYLLCFKNSLAFVHDYPSIESEGMGRGKGNCFDVWLLGEYGNTRSWSKHLTIGPLYGVEIPLGFTKTGELILEDNQGELVGSHSIFALDAKKLLRIRGARRTVRALGYRETLVSLKMGQIQAGASDYTSETMVNFKPFIRYQFDPEATQMP